MTLPKIDLLRKSTRVDIMGSKAGHNPCYTERCSNIDVGLLSMCKMRIGGVVISQQF